MENTISTSATFGPFRRGLASALVALTVFSATLIGTAQPAHAASYVYGCFRSDRAGENIDGIAVQLMAFINGQWQAVYNTNTISVGPNRGCIGIPIPAGYARTLYWRLSVNATFGAARFIGTTPLIALPGDLMTTLGTGTVTCVGCAN